VVGRVRELRRQQRAYGCKGMDGVMQGHAVSFWWLSAAFYYWFNGNTPPGGGKTVQSAA
jgi:hypothetical protein